MKKSLSNTDVKNICTSLNRVEKILLKKGKWQTLFTRILLNFVAFSVIGE